MVLGSTVSQYGGMLASCDEQLFSPYVEGYEYGWPLMVATSMPP